MTFEERDKVDWAKETLYVTAIKAVIIVRQLDRTDFCIGNGLANGMSLAVLELTFMMSFCYVTIVFQGTYTWVIGTPETKL